MRALTMSCFALLLASGCVFDTICTGGAVRNRATGRCTESGSDDGGVDGGGVDGGADGGGVDGGADGGGVDAGPPLRIESFSVGVAHACAIDSRGTLRCWGANLIGQLATGDIAAFDTPQVIDLGARVTAVTGNTITLCAQTSAPSVHCWGNNEHGQVGNGMTSASPVTVPFELSGLGAGRQLSASFATTCFASFVGGVVCWGRNDEGQLGIGTVTAAETSPGPSMMESPGRTLEDIAEVAVADRHVCARTNDGRLFCAGANGNAELGLGDTSARTFATQITSMTAVTSISNAASHTCAVNAGDVYCWGDNDHGQAGSSLGIITTPILVSGTTGATQVWTGDSVSCALLDSREVVCWGSRMHGGIGDGMPASADIVTTPVTVSGLSDVVAIAGSYFDLACALTAAGELYCWGEDAAAMVGGAAPGATTAFLDGMTRHTSPIRVDPLP